MADRSARSSDRPNSNLQPVLADDVAIEATIKLPIWHFIIHPHYLECATGLTKGMTMSDLMLPQLPGRVRGRPFEKGRSGNPADPLCCMDRQPPAA
jgi:hypothetical protein